MDPNTGESLAYYNFLAWLNDNKKKLAIGLAAVIALIAASSFTKWNKEQKEIKANEALLTLPSLVSPTRQVVTNAYPADFIKVAESYRGTEASVRANLIAASLLFSEGKYQQAKEKFESLSSQDLDKGLQGQVDYGIASSLDAAGNTAEAQKKYQEVSSKHPGSTVANLAKLSLGRLYEAANKPEEALRQYDSITSLNPYDSWTGEARERREALLVKFPQLAKPVAVSPAPGSAAPATNTAIPAAR